MISALLGGMVKLHALRRAESRVPTENGFTVIELMVVVALTGIMSSIAFVSYGGLRKQATVEDVHSRLYAALELSKAEAAARGELIGCAFLANGLACFGLAPGADLLSPALEFHAGLVTASTDIDEIIVQERFNQNHAIDTVLSTGVLPSGTGLGYFRSDGAFIDGEQSPADFSLRLHSNELASAVSTLHIRSTGSITKGL